MKKIISILACVCLLLSAIIIPASAAEATTNEIVLTVDSLGLPSNSYNSTNSTGTVDGVDFEWIQLGNYGDGIQVRDKDGKTSSFWNTSAFSAPIKEIKLVYSDSKSTYNNPDAEIFSFGNEAGTYNYETKLSTVSGTKEYTITPDAETYTFLKFEHDYSYSMYWKSITIVLAGSSEGGEVTPPAADDDEPTVTPPADTANDVVLTVDSLGLPSDSYNSTNSTGTVDGVDFEWIQLGNYGDGIQVRDKDGKTSSFWNTSAFSAPIKEIKLVYSDSKSTYDNPDAEIFSFGNEAGTYTYETKLSTVAGTKEYTITPDAETYTFLKFEHDYGYSMYWKSITIVLAGSSEGGEVTPPAGGDDEGGEVTPPAGGDDEEVTPSTPAEIVDAAYALAAGEKLTNVTLTGTVVEVIEYSADYGNTTIKMVIEGKEDKPINCKRMVVSSETDVQVGDIITVTGDIENNTYQGTTTIQFYKPTLDKVVKADGGEVTPPAGGDDEGGEVTPPADDEPTVTPPASDSVDNVVLTVDSLALPFESYNSGEVSGTVGGVNFSWIQLGNYGNGIQVRDKDGKTSSFWNTTAFSAPIKEIKLVYNSEKNTYDNPDAEIFSFGNAVGAYTYETKLSTVAGTKEYTITPDAETYTFLKFEHDLGYSMYWDSITIVLVGGQDVVVTPPAAEEEKKDETPAGSETPNQPEEQQQLVFGVVEQPEAGKAYKFGMYHGNLKKTLYITGAMDGYYMATTDDVNKAADVYLEQTEGGYYIYALVNGAKKYLGVKEAQGSDGKTHINAVYTDAPISVFTYNATLKTYVTKLGDKEYGFGTRNDKSYNTVSPTDTQYTDNFFCQFYGMTASGNSPATGDAVASVAAMALAMAAVMVYTSKKR